MFLINSFNLVPRQLLDRLSIDFAETSTRTHTYCKHCAQNIKWSRLCLPKHAIISQRRIMCDNYERYFRRISERNVFVMFAVRTVSVSVSASVSTSGRHCVLN